MAIRIDFSPLSNPRITSDAAVRILESYDPLLQRDIDYTTSPYPGEKFSVLVLAQYQEQCNELGLIPRAEVWVRHWARNHFDKSAYQRLIAISLVFRKTIRNPASPYFMELEQIENLIRNLRSTPVTLTPMASIAGLDHHHVAVGGMTLRDGTLSRRHIAVDRAGSSAASWQTAPQPHVAIDIGANPYRFPAESRRESPLYRSGGSSTRGAHVGVGSRL